MFVCNYNRKTFAVDHRQKYVEIAKDCLWIEIADERLQFLQTKHLQCRGAISGSLWKPLWLTSEVIEIERRERVQAIKLLSVWQQDAENISLLNDNRATNLKPKSGRRNCRQLGHHYCRQRANPNEVRGRNGL